MNDTTYNLDEIVDFRSSIPNGEYEAKLVDVALGSTKNGDPALSATFEILNGENAGDNFTKKYYLVPFITKKGTKGNTGLTEFRNDATAIGEITKVPRQFTATEFRKIYASIFGKKKLRIRKFQENDSKGALREDGTPVTWPKYKIFGVVSSNDRDNDPLKGMGF